MTSAWLHANKHRFSDSKRPPLLADADDGREPKRLRIETETTVSDHAVAVGVRVEIDQKSQLETFADIAKTALASSCLEVVSRPDGIMTMTATPIVAGCSTDANETQTNLFPVDEVAVLAPHGNAFYGTYRRIQSNDFGKLLGDCGHCSNKGLEIVDFAPDKCNNNIRKRPAFLAALAEYNEAYAARDYEAAAKARATLEKLRTRNCIPCRKTTRTLTGNVKKCRDFWQWFKKEACAGPNGGCSYQDCVERGPLAAYVIEADHIDPEEKVNALSEYKWWSWNGGVAAMRIEAEKVRMICRFCHTLEKTGTQARRSGDPKLMPAGKWNGTKVEVAQSNAKHHATITHPKQAYVDAEKLRRGHCLHCKRPVTAATAFAFDFDHRDPETKLIGKETLAGKKGGVAGLVSNRAKRASLPKIKRVIDTEAELCDLLCCNCHKRVTWGYPMRS